MAWPKVHIPPGKGPTAEQHLGKIAKAARDAGTNLLTDIEKAIQACEKAACLKPGATPARGKPPKEPDHCNAVLLARYYATAAPDWDACLSALRHGE